MVKHKSKNQVPLGDQKSSHTPKSWPDLPQPLLSLISREGNLLYNIHPKGEIKTWMTKSSKCNTSNFFSSSWLERFDKGKETAGTLNSIAVKTHLPESWWWRLRLPKYSYWDDKHPWLGVVFSLDPEIYCFRKNTCIAMVFTGISSSAFGFQIITTLGDCRRKWKKQDCNIVDPHCSNPYERKHYMRFPNAIGFKGKFYAVSLQGTLVVIEDIDRVIGITGVCNQRAVPSVSSKHYRECLLESDGKILLVFLISRRSIKIVDVVEVYKLDDANLKLTKLESLGDTALFLGANCCMVISARRLPGCNKNSIYFAHNSADKWWLYDMETGSISPGWNDSSPMNLQVGLESELDK